MSRIVTVLVIVGVVFVLAYVAIMLVALPAVQAAREETRQTLCYKNLKQISLALMIYDSAHRRLPPAFVPDENGRPKHSWRVLILPYLEQRAVFQQYDFKEPFDGPRNRELASVGIPPYRCLSDPAASSGQTDYVMIVGPGTISDGPKSHGMWEIEDGTSDTIMVIEVCGLGINWMEPRDVSLEELIAKLNNGTLRGPHPGKIHVAMCYGSLRSLTLPIDPQRLRAMATIAGDEPVAPP